jgi:integrase
VFQRAVRDGLISKNPVRDVEKVPLLPKRPPPFSLDTVKRVGAALRQRAAEGERAPGLGAVRFLMLSGCRRMEALTLRWEMIDRKARCVRFPDTKTGPAIRPLGVAALIFLESFRPKDAKPSDYVFLGNTASGHFNDLPRTWRRVCNIADINGASIHSLRHWYASCGAEMNISELLIAGLLGHRVRSVTGRYATAPDTALLGAADRVSLRLADALDGVESGKVINLSA